MNTIKMFIKLITLMIVFFSTLSQAQDNRQQRGQRSAPGTGEEQDSDMAQAVAGAVAQLPPLPAGPYKPTWESVRENYRYPEWFHNAKFGIYMHWGLYSVPARQSEWYYRHMYGNQEIRNWHIQHFGPLNVFGYKEFIPMFKAEKYDPEQWAAMFKDAGARYVALTAEHHDGFSLWDSRINKRNAVNMGPRRDLVGDLAGSVLDHERQSRAEQEIYPDPWQVDESVHSRWGYLAETNYLDVNAVVWRIVENTSKNGNLLLNFSPMPDGTFNQVQIDLLKGIGVWMRQNGEGIYETRPWIKYGEGPSCLRSQRPNQPPYEPSDFRFTRKENILYVFVMAWPENGISTIKSLAASAKGFSGKINRITMLGTEGKLQFSQDAEGLHVTLPQQRPGQHIWTLKIEGLKLEAWQPKQ